MYNGRCGTVCFFESSCVFYSLLSPPGIRTLLTPAFAVLFLLSGVVLSCCCLIGFLLPDFSIRNEVRPLPSWQTTAVSEVVEMQPTLKELPLEQDKLEWLEDISEAGPF